MRLVRTTLILVSSLIGSAYAEGDALVDSLGPREVAVGEAMRGAATGASAIGLNPAGLALNRELVFEGGYGYRFSDDASLLGVSACDSTVAAPGCFFYQYASSSPEAMSRRMHIAGTSVGYPITPRVSLGSTIKYFNFKSDVMDEGKQSGFNWDVGTTLRISELVNVGIAGYNLWGAKSPEMVRATGFGVLVRPVSSLALSFDARWKLDGDDRSARYGGGGELFLRTSNGQSGFPLRAGVLRDNGLGATYLSGGVGYAAMRFGVDVAARYAIAGVDETTIIASMRFWGPRLQAPSLDSKDVDAR